MLDDVPDRFYVILKGSVIVLKRRDEKDIIRERKVLNSVKYTLQKPTLKEIKEKSKNGEEGIDIKEVLNDYYGYYDHEYIIKLFGWKRSTLILHNLI